MKIEKFAKCFLVGAGTFLAVRGALEAVRAVKESADPEKSGEPEETGGRACIFRGIAMVFVGGLAAGAGLLSHLIDVEGRIAESCPEAAGKLRAADDQFARAQEFAREKLALAGQKGSENLAALRDAACARWKDYLEARGAAGEDDG
jgi:hypothetical protein